MRPLTAAQRCLSTTPQACSSTETQAECVIFAAIKRHDQQEAHRRYARLDAYGETGMFGAISRVLLLFAAVCCRCVTGAWRPDTAGQDPSRRRRCIALSVVGDRQAVQRNRRPLQRRGDLARRDPDRGALPVQLPDAAVHSGGVAAFSRGLSHRTLFGPCADRPLRDRPGLRSGALRPDLGLGLGGADRDREACRSISSRCGFAATRRRAGPRRCLRVIRRIAPLR